MWNEEFKTGDLKWLSSTDCCEVLLMWSGNELGAVHKKPWNAACLFDTSLENIISYLGKSVSAGSEWLGDSASSCFLCQCVQSRGFSIWSKTLISLLPCLFMLVLFLLFGVAETLVPKQRDRLSNALLQVDLSRQSLQNSILFHVATLTWRR
jgi:hypothetical protein